jgi:hypothetical protein
MGYSFYSLSVIEVLCITNCDTDRESDHIADIVQCNICVTFRSVIALKSVIHKLRSVGLTAVCLCQQNTQTCWL